jgi:hypothetical protein
MAASQKRRQGSGDAAASKLQVGLFVAVAAFIFFIGYSFGGHKATGGQEGLTAKELHHQEEALEKQQQECNKHHELVMASIGRLGEEEASVQDTHASLEQQNRDLREAHDQQEVQMADCETELDVAKSRWTDEDHTLAAKIKALAEETETMEELLRDLTEGHGMRQVLLSQALFRQRKMFNDLRGRLGVTEEPLSEVAILEKHQKTIKTMDNEMRSRLDERLNKTVTTWEKFSYIPENHTAIFLDTRDLYGNVVRPRYFNRMMQDVRPGTLKITPRPPVKTLSQRVIDLMSTAFCAYRNDNPNFTFPDTFAWRHAEDVENMHEIVDTPLVTFCTNCVTYMGTNLFRDACKNDRVRNNYGNYDFWAARSMIRFSPVIEDKAEAFIADHGFNPKTTLAVVFHASEKALMMCEGANRVLPGPHYLMVRGGLSVDVLHGTEDAEMRCAPSAAYLESRIREVLEEEAKKSPLGIPSITTIYLSNEPEALATLKKADFGNVEIVSGEQHSAAEEAIDILVAAKLGAVLVSAYLPQSQVVTEQYLLNNAFDTSHLYFF